MFDHLRVPLIIVTSLLFAFGAFTFWQGKSVVETNRAESKPQEISIYDLEVTTPKNFGWYRITRGDAAMIGGVAINEGATSAKAAKRIDAVYIPLLKTMDVPHPYIVTKEGATLPPAFVMIHTREKNRRDFAELLFRMRNENLQTYNDWIEQNRSDIFLEQPIEGILHRPTRRDLMYLQEHPYTVTSDFWVLEENVKPLPQDNPQVSIGLGLMLGMPTLWVFVLLISGKLAPPDEEILPIAALSAAAGGPVPAAPNRPASAVSTMPIASVMPGASEEMPTKKPRG